MIFNHHNKLPTFNQIKKAKGLIIYGMSDFDYETENGRILKEWISYVHKHFEIRILGIGSGHKFIVDTFGGKT